VYSNSQVTQEATNMTSNASTVSLWRISDKSMKGGATQSLFPIASNGYGDSPQVLFASQPSLRLSPPDKVTAQVLLETISARAASAAN